MRIPPSWCCNSAVDLSLYSNVSIVPRAYKSQRVILHLDILHRYCRARRPRSYEVCCCYECCYRECDRGEEAEHILDAHQRRVHGGRCVRAWIAAVEESIGSMMLNTAMSLQCLENTFPCSIWLSSSLLSYLDACGESLNRLCDISGESVHFHFDTVR